MEGFRTIAAHKDVWSGANVPDKDIKPDFHQVNVPGLSSHSAPEANPMSTQPSQGDIPLRQVKVEPRAWKRVLSKEKFVIDISSPPSKKGRGSDGDAQDNRQHGGSTSSGGAGVEVPLRHNIDTGDDSDVIMHDTSDMIPIENGSIHADAGSSQAVPSDSVRPQGVLTQELDTMLNEIGANFFDLDNEDESD